MISSDGGGKSLKFIKLFSWVSSIIGCLSEKAAERLFVVSLWWKMIGMTSVGIKINSQITSVCWAVKISLCHHKSILSHYFLPFSSCSTHSRMFQCFIVILKMNMALENRHHKKEHNLKYYAEIKSRNQITHFTTTKKMLRQKNFLT